MSLLALVLPGVALAVPGVLPVQGVLTTAGGERVHGTVSVRFSLFSDATSTDAFYVDTLPVVVEDGRFATGVGSGSEALDLNAFATHSAAWLEVQVDNDPPMPRVALSPVPYAAAAERTRETARFDGHPVDDVLAVIPSDEDIDAIATAICYDDSDELVAALGDTLLTVAAPAAALSAADITALSNLSTGSSRWNDMVAYGDHSAAGYLTSEVDPVFSAAPAATLDTSDLERLTAVTSRAEDWSTAHSWGDHQDPGYLTTESDPFFASSPAADLDGQALQAVVDRGGAWDQMAAWPDHRLAGYPVAGPIVGVTGILNTRFRFQTPTTFIAAGGAVIPATTPPTTCMAAFVFRHAACGTSQCDTAVATWTPAVQAVGSTTPVAIDETISRDIDRTLLDEQVMALSGDATTDQQLGCLVSNLPAQPVPALATCTARLLCVH